MLRANPRLMFVFDLCRTMNILDPFQFMNSCPPVVIDGWIAFVTVENSRKKSRMMKPEEALKTLSAKVENHGT